MAAGGGKAAATLWSVDAERVCTAKASQLLDSNPGALAGAGDKGLARWRMGDFMERWRQMVPEELRPG